MQNLGYGLRDELMRAREREIVMGGRYSSLKPANSGPWGLRVRGLVARWLGR